MIGKMSHLLTIVAFYVSMIVSGDDNKVTSIDSKGNSILRHCRYIAGLPMLRNAERCIKWRAPTQSCTVALVELTGSTDETDGLVTFNRVLLLIIGWIGRVRCKVFQIPVQK